MAHQLSCNDEYLNGTINQYYGCCFLRPRWRDRIRSVRYRRNLLFGDLYAWFWIQHWVASNGSSKEWRARLQGNRQDLFSRLIFLLGLAIFLYLLIHTVSPFILKKLIVSSDIYRAVILYLDWRSFGLLFSFPFLAIRSFLVGITHTKALSWAAAIAVLINIPLNFYLIFTRELGISGAAIASSLAEMGSFMMLSFYMWIRLDKEKYGLRPVYNGNLLIKVLKLSIWSMLHAFISVAPWFLFSFQLNIWENRVSDFQYNPERIGYIFCDSEFFCAYNRLISQ